MKPTPKPPAWWLRQQRQQQMARELERLGAVAPLRREQDEARLASYDEVAAAQAATVATAAQEAAQRAQQARSSVEAERPPTPANLAQQVEAAKDAAVREAIAAARADGRPLPSVEEVAALHRAVIARYLPQRAPVPSAPPALEDEAAEARDDVADWVRRAF